MAKVRTIFMFNARIAAVLRSKAGMKRAPIAIGHLRRSKLTFSFSPGLISTVKPDVEESLYFAGMGTYFAGFPNWIEDVSTVTELLPSGARSVEKVPSTIIAEV